MSTTGILQETGTVLSEESGDDLAKEFDTYRNEVLADTPISFWLFDETSGTNAVDEMAANAGTYHATVTLGETGPLADGTSKSFKTAKSGYVTAADSASLHLGDGPFSFEVWFKLLGTSGVPFGNLIDKGPDPNGLRIDLDTAGQISVVKIGVATIVGSTVNITDTTTWHHLVVTKNGAANKIWIDGVDRTGSVTNQTVSTNSGDLYIGSTYAPSLKHNGWLSRQAVYGSVLSAARIGVHYAAGVNL